MISNQLNLSQQKLVLSQQETELFDFFHKFLEEEKINVTLRVAGGWVRDKLLGLPSDDIDIAIDTMMGEELIQKIVKYLDQKGEGIKGHGVIKTNPEKSKHLETATCKLKGFSIDFVNLRGEEYGEDSRIPTIVFGTPLQDAERRDLTINSMFYNINENKIEDFTQKGFQDLQNKLIRTPLNPVKTFFDDPLRILRAIRFAARFEYTIDEATVQAFKQPEIKHALKEKVSKERVKQEFEKMLKGKNPQYGLDLIYKNNLWQTIFVIPQQCEELFKNPQLQEQVEGTAYKLCVFLTQQYQQIMKTQFLQQNYDQSEIKLYSYLSACCYPYIKYAFKKGKNNIDLTNYLMSDSLKGNDVKQLFNLDQQGPKIKLILGNVFIWQVKNQQLTKEDLIKYIENNKEEFLEQNPF